MARITVRGIFIRGLVALLPVIATVYLVVWLVTGLESLLGTVLRELLPEGLYVPGMGLAVGVVIIFVVGLLMQAWLAREIWEIGERILRRMPLVRAIFGAAKEIVGYISGTNRPQGQAVVAVKIGDPPVRVLGLITREDLSFLTQDPDDTLVCVFLAWSYQVGGFTIFVPRSSLEPVAMSPQEAFRLSFTAGVTSQTGTKL
jgi:uncharacterized membrane protein